MNLNIFIIMFSSVIVIIKIISNIGMNKNLMNRIIIKVILIVCSVVGII